MATPFSILHISDLHRSVEDPISNQELISALISDQERYTRENPKIRAPEAIVVSGDLIQGVPLNFPNFQKELKLQYRIAREFLEELVKRFLAGDKSKIVIIPGNHDVDWNTAFAAMREFDSDQIPNDFAKGLFSESSKYRWDWKNRRAYQIIDDELYNDRLEAFWSFFEDFYKDVPGLFSVKSRTDVNLWVLNDNRIAVAAFNSCEGNDCFAFHGSIKKEAVASSHIAFHDSGNFELRIAVWHHNIDGPPYRSDYMDVDLVKGMIGRGFRIGMYGHQHKAQAAPYQIWLPSKERMAVISAGSLCAGARELPRGFNRQYNIVEIAEDLKSVKVHVREMSVSNLFGRGSFPELGGKTFAELNWELPVNEVGQHINVNFNRRISTVQSAERLNHEGDGPAAFEKLRQLDLAHLSYERRLFLNIAQQLERWSTIVDLTSPPLSIEELVLRFNSLLKLHRSDDATNALDKYSKSLGLDAATERDLRRKTVAF
jgi:hypothetical protein